MMSRRPTQSKGRLPSLPRRLAWLKKTPVDLREPILEMILEEREACAELCERAGATKAALVIRRQSAFLSLNFQPARQPC